MLVGFGIKNPLNDDESDLARLTALGCERSFLVEDTDELDKELIRVLEFLRPGDVLVVVTMSRLASDFRRLLEVLQKLTALQIALHADEEDVRPGTPLGDSFLACSTVLSNAVRAYGEVVPRAGEAREKRSRGRPPALTASQQIKAARLLEEKRASVLEVARILQVSPATIYRYFPKNRRPSRSVILIPQAREPRHR